MGYHGAVVVLNLTRKGFKEASLTENYPTWHCQVCLYNLLGMGTINRDVHTCHVQQMLPAYIYSVRVSESHLIFTSTRFSKRPKILSVLYLNSYSAPARASSVDIVPTLWSGWPINWGCIPGRGRVSSSFRLLLGVHFESGTHLTLYPMSTGEIFICG
jgi:hypothetical protein